MSYKLKYLLLILLVIPIVSCQDDFLDRVPTDAVDDTEALSSLDNLQAILNGIHRGLYTQSQNVFPGGNTGRANNHYWVPMGDNLVGYLIHSANANNLSWRSTMQWNQHTLPTSLTTRILWYHRYNIIVHANIIINRINEGEFLESEQLYEILGQAYTYRAYAYLSLVQHYGRGYLIGNPTTDPGVPILFATEPPYESEPRSTVEQVYQQIEADLDAAIDAFELGTGRIGSGAVAKSQLNINVAHGLKARWALSKGEWVTAAESAVAAREGFPLMDETAWLSGFNTTTLSEVIWGSHVIQTETAFFRSYFYLASNTFNGSQVRNNPKIADRRLVDAIPATDYRGKAFLPDAPNSNSSAANGEGGWDDNTNPLYTTEEEFNEAIAAIKSEYGLVSGHNTHPYMHFKLKNENPGSIDPDDIIYMRSSEMYLIEAEAMVMMNDLAGARAALAPLGGERDSAYDVNIFDTRDSLLEHIKFQRRLELWGEGFGYTDKIRWDEGIDHAADGGSGASETLYQQSYQIERPSINDDWIFKIPQAEIDANPNITPADQN
ncbi:RagB/SusD family nutrient uptake outer membrane protein [Aquimarina sp. U1-2]|uniref:RagB/SusD family nutrient uptake outer membrane protein n=1 Tax=Aquimarina sp. U1-2 TaxID=2823141 RepID=UPI001AEC92C6|nr:RagB/SusD family nutrient uptake outer membrane protein [Aquimarina sp. U1-2]MBP2833395.1 RagB/SusD family nutrient uptake outer membrane protein [Aquimarina sp. U1-2]